MIFPNLKLPSSLEEYQGIEEILKSKDESLVWNVYWVLSRADLFFLLKYVLSTGAWLKKKEGIENERWIFDRCRDVQTNSNRVLDVWARFHWKTLIKTFGNIIRYVLVDPDYTFCILSNTRPIAKQFLSQIQREMINNELLQMVSWHPEMEKRIFPSNPKEFPRLSLDDGIIVRRPSNPKEATLSAAGLVDSLPVGPHYRVRAYDDVVTKASVATSEMIKKTTNSWELSLPLGMPGDEAWYTGTFYAHDDTYHELLARGTDCRIHPCYEIDHENSEMDPDTGAYLKLAHHMDRPVLYHQDHLRRLFREMGAEEGSKNAAMQMLCDANAGLSVGFERDWIQYYHTDPMEEARGKNIYLLVDPANEKKKYSDYTAMMVVGVGADRNYYILDIVRDRMSLHERAEMVFSLHQMWEPMEVRYEQYGLQADIGHIEYLQERRGYRFPIQKVGGIVRKQDRIERLVPLFQNGFVYLPLDCRYKDHSGESLDLVKTFITGEYLKFPNSTHTDMLDALSRIAEPDEPVLFPDPSGGRSRIRYAADPNTFSDISWMGA